MNIDLLNSSEGCAVDWSRSDVEYWCRVIEKEENKVIGNLCFYFVSEEEILRTNRYFLNHDYLTDVITFAEVRKGIYSGDIFICLKEVFRNASFLSIENRIELSRVIIHGVLHVLGWEDRSVEQRERMHLREDFYMEAVGLFS